MPFRSLIFAAVLLAPGGVLAAEAAPHGSDLAPSVVLTLAWVAVSLAHLQRRRAARAEEKARYFASHDPMTGLLNRPHFVTALDDVLARSGGEAVAVLSIDLAGLREVNEHHGYEGGDAAILRVADALAACAGASGLAARLGGDKFALAARGRGAPESPESVALQVLEAIGRPFPVGGLEVRLTARIGISVAPDDGTTASRLLGAAGLALERARLKGGPGFVIFERTLEAELQRRRELERQIRLTLAEEAFELHFQPLFGGSQDRLTGFEALLRMPGPSGGFVPPGVFIPVAEEIGLIGEIGDWVLRRACMLAAHWPDHLTVAVNLSPAQFRRGGVHRSVEEALAGSGLPPRRLELEITEGLILSDDATVLQELRDLKALGVAIVMDDFGTGYSSLSYLWKFPFDKIKIDRSFMSALDGEDRQVVDIIQAILSLSRSLRLRVTAEGVETPEQAAFLKSVGCDEVQGFHFGRPMPITEVALAILRDVQAQSGLTPTRSEALRQAG